jgi:hypothetical protein
MLTAAIAVDRNEIDKWAPTYLGYGVASGGIGALHRLGCRCRRVEAIGQIRSRPTE